MKKLFALLTIATFCGFGAFGVKSYNVVRAENETSSIDFPNSSESYEQSITSYQEESGSDTTKEEDEKVTFFDDISQTAKDTIAVIKETLNQPVVIGGISMTLGSLILYLLTKVIDKVTKSKIGSKSAEEIKVLYAKLTNEQTSRKELEETTKKLYKVIAVLIDNLKNANVRENALELLGDLEKVAENNTQKVVEETIEVGVSAVNEVMEILNKD